MTSPIQQFLEAVRQTPELWQSIDIRVLAVRENGPWQNLLTRCYLDSKPPDAVARHTNLPVTLHAGCWQDVRPCSQLEELLKAIEIGVLGLCGESIQYIAPRAHPSDQKYSFNSYDFIDISERERVAYRLWSSHSLSAVGNSWRDVLGTLTVDRSTLDHELRAHAAPLDGLGGALQLAIGSPDSVEIDHYCRFEVFAPFEAKLVPERCALRGGRVQFAVRVGSRAVQQRASLGMVAVGSSPVSHRQSVLLAEAPWRQEGIYWLTADEIPAEACHTATLLLRVGALSVHRLTRRDPLAGSGSLPMTAYRLFDPELKILRESLGMDRPTDADPFERAVTRLLLLLGFQVDRLSGDKRLEDAVDVLAYAVLTNDCLAVECTTGAIAPRGKLSKLIARRAEIAAGARFEHVWGVAATALPINRIPPADLEQAAANSIVVLASEDLAELLLLASNGAPTSEALAFLAGRVPPKPSSLQLPMPAHPRRG
jgi:hypothetical protein